MSSFSSSLVCHIKVFEMKEGKKRKKEGKKRKMDLWKKLRTNHRESETGKALLMREKDLDDKPTVIMLEVKDVPEALNRNNISKGTDRAYQVIHRKILRSRNNQEDFELIFLNILKPGVRAKDAPPPPSWDFRKEDDFLDVRRGQWTDGLRLLRFLVADMNLRGIPCRGRIREGLRHKVICNQTNTLHNRPDFLVVEGPSPRPLLRRMLGVSKEINVSKYCVQHASCPVMVFRFLAEEERQSDTRGKQIVTQV